MQPWVHNKLEGRLLVTMKGRGGVGWYCWRLGWQNDMFCGDGLDGDRFKGRQVRRGFPGALRETHQNVGAPCQALNR